MKYYKYIRLILILIPLIILAGLIYQDINPQGYLKLSYDFCQPTPFISEFSPHGRVLDVQENETGCTQAMVIDPVYFDLRLPQRFDEVRIKLWYQKDPSTPLQIGPAIDLDSWEWQLQDIHYLKTKDGWLFGQASYDLTELKLDRNRLRFLISSPGLDMGHGEIVFHRLELDLIKAPLTLNNWITRLNDWFKFTNPYFLIN